MPVGGRARHRVGRPWRSHRGRHRQRDGILVHREGEDRLEGLVDPLAADDPGHVDDRLEIRRIGGVGHRRLLGHALDEVVEIGQSELARDRRAVPREGGRRMDRRDFLPGVGLGQEEGPELDGAVHVMGKRGGEGVAEGHGHRVHQTRIDGLAGGHHAGRIDGSRGDDRRRIGEGARLSVGAVERHHAGRRSAEPDAEQDQGQECAHGDGDQGEHRSLAQSRVPAPGQLSRGHLDAGSPFDPGR